MLVPGLYSIPAGVSAPITVKPAGVSSWECMILSASGESGWPYSPKVFRASSPPSTPW